jgi:Asp-tRNA(Asn)/Glu-tRNA(Gln) amidotransferase A subunit family amidase
MDDTAVHGPLTAPSRTPRSSSTSPSVPIRSTPTRCRTWPPYREALPHLPRGLRIGWSGDLGYAVVQRDVGEIAYDAARVFADLGHELRELDTRRRP